MDEWPTVTLGDVCSKPQYGAIAAASEQPIGPLLVRQTDLVDGQIDWSSVPYCELDPSEYSKYSLETDDLLVARLGSIGRSARVRDPRDAVYAGYLVRFRAHRERALPAFLGYQLQSPGWWQHVNAVRSGAVQPTLNAKQMSAYSFSLPPLSEQRAIAEVLGALDDKIEANRRLSNLCDQVATCLFSLASRQLLTLSEVADIIMGQSPPGSTYNEDRNGLPFYQGCRDFGARFPSPRVWCSQPSRIAERHDVLVSVRAPVGSLNVASERCAIGRGVAAVRSTSAPSTLFHVLAANDSVWDPYESEGTVFGCIRKDQLKGLIIEWPEDPTGELERALSALDAVVESLVIEASVLTSLRDTLLPKLLSGELRVRDAAPLLEDAV
jgi:type I restriction enzyme S subunit